MNKQDYTYRVLTEIKRSYPDFYYTEDTLQVVSFEFDNPYSKNVSSPIQATSRNIIDCYIRDKYSEHITYTK